jgi:hypothetical protein
VRPRGGWIPRPRAAPVGGFPGGYGGRGGLERARPRRHRGQARQARHTGRRRGCQRQPRQAGAPRSARHAREIGYPGDGGLLPLGTAGRAWVGIDGTAARPAPPARVVAEAWRRRPEGPLRDRRRGARRRCRWRWRRRRWRRQGRDGRRRLLRRLPPRLDADARRRSSITTSDGGRRWRGGPGRPSRARRRRRAGRDVLHRRGRRRRRRRPGRPRRHRRRGRRRCGWSQHRRDERAGGSTATIAGARIEVGRPGPAGAPGPGGGSGGPPYPGIATPVYP